MPGKFDFENVDLSKEPNQKRFDEELNKLPEEEKDKVMFDTQEKAERENEEFDKEKESEIETVEKELSPEVIGMIMDKVQDIDKEGIGFWALRYYLEGFRKKEENLKSIFKNGIMGTYSNIYRRGSVDSKEYGKLLKEKKVYSNFNIIGRINDHYQYIGRRKILNAEWTNFKNTGYILLINASKFEEIDNKGAEGRDKINWNRLKIRQFMANNPATRIGKKTDSEFGFMLSGRVAPRYFTGLMINADNYGFAKENEEINKDLKLLTIKSVKCMKETYQDKPNLFVPIYDHKGNLIWPKKMTYNQVKKFVAEKNMEKKETNKKSE